MDALYVGKHMSRLNGSTNWFSGESCSWINQRFAPFPTYSS